MLFHGRGKCVILFICLSCTLFSNSLWGQEKSDTLSYKATITIGGSYKTGLLNQTNITGTYSHSINKANWELFNRASYFYSRVNDRQILNDWTVVSRLHYSFSSRVIISPALFHLYKSNLLFRILNSHRVLVGAKITPLENKEALLYLGVGVENTHYAGEEFANSVVIDSNRRFAISTFHVENTHHFSDPKLSLSYSLFYFQSLQERSDFTIWVIPSFNISINQQLSLALAYDFRYRNVHLLDLPSTNQALTVNLSVFFNT